MSDNSRRQTITAIVVGVLVFGTIIFAAEFGTGAENPPMPTRTVTVTVTVTPDCSTTPSTRHEERT